MKRILVVDDDIFFLALVCLLVKSEMKDVEVLTSNTLIGGQEIFRQHVDEIDLVALDGCLTSGAKSSDPPETLGFASEIKHNKSFKGVVVAISGSEEQRQALIRAGCDYECEKMDFSHTASMLLKAA